MPVIIKLVIWVAIVVAICLYGSSSVQLQTFDKPIVILRSHAADPHKMVEDGFEHYLQGTRQGVSFEQYDLQGDPARAYQVVSELKAAGPKALILAIGSLATEVAAKHITDTPIIATLILRLEAFQHGNNVTAVVLEFPVETQLEWIRHILPECRTIGVIYNPQENLGMVETAQRIAKNMGLKLEAEQIASSVDIPIALTRLANKIDVLWGLPDRLALAQETTKAILLFCFRNRIPLVGPSEAWVKAGALFSLD